MDNMIYSTKDEGIDKNMNTHVLEEIAFSRTNDGNSIIFLA